MSNKAVEYKSRYPKIFEELFEAYKAALEKGANPTCIEHVIGIINTLAAAKADGVVSIEFARNFHNDVTYIVDVVNRQVRSDDMSRGQRFLTFGMANLQKAFGAQ